MLAGLGECAGVMYGCVPRACNTCIRAVGVVHAAKGGRERGSFGGGVHFYTASVLSSSACRRERTAQRDEVGRDASYEQELKRL